MITKGKKLSTALCLVLFVVLVFAGLAYAQATDIQGHWAESQINSWTDQGLAKGYQDGTFKPNNSITRAEFITLVNRAFDFNETVEINFTDVKSTDWFAGEIAKAKAVGYVGGYSDGSIKPNNQITRQEAASMLARILQLDTSNVAAVANFKDAQSIPQWSKGSIGAVVAKGYMGGYPDQTFKPTRSITRAEAIVTLDRAIGGVKAPEPKPEPTPEPAPTPTIPSTYDEPGTYGPEKEQQVINDDVTISEDGVTLRNTTIKGDLTLAKGIGDGDVTLKNVVVEGKTYIYGGGENSITLDNCELAETTVDKEDNEIRLILKDTTIDKLIANSGMKLEGDGKITDLTINVDGVEVEIKPVNEPKLKRGVEAIVAGKEVRGSSSGGGGGGGGGGGSTPASTANVADATQLASALNNSNIKTINFTADITADITADRLINLNFANYTLTGNVSINTDATGSITISGSADPSITGTLTVDTPNATVTNQAKISGKVTILAVAKGTWNEEADGNRLDVRVNDGVIIIKGNAGSVTVTEGGNGLSITVSSGGKVQTLTVKDTVASIKLEGEVASAVIEVPIKIEGGQNIKKAEIKVNDVELDEAPQEVELGENVDKVNIGEEERDKTWIANSNAVRKAQAALDLGDLSAVTADLTLPTTVEEAEITWESSDTNVIANDGTVTRPAIGKDDVTVTLTATIKVGEVEATKTFEVIVKAQTEDSEPVSAISVTPKELTLTVGETGKITATVEPDNASNKDVTWSTTDESIATVEADGNVATVTAVTEGTAIITVTSDADSSIKAICEVAVEAPEVEPVEVVRADGDVTQDTGKTGGTDLSYNFAAEGKVLTIDAKDTKLPYYEADGSTPPRTANWVGVAIPVPADVDTSKVSATINGTDCVDLFFADGKYMEYIDVKAADLTEGAATYTWVIKWGSGYADETITVKLINVAGLEAPEVEPEPAKLVATGSYGIHDNIVYAGYKLQDEEDTQIPLIESNIKSISVKDPDGNVTELTVVGETDPYLWFNIAKKAGTYTYTVVTKGEESKTYEATIEWEKPAVATVKFQAPDSAKDVFTEATDDNPAQVDFSKVTADKLYDWSTDEKPGYYAIELKIEGVDLNENNVKNAFRVYGDGTAIEPEIKGDLDCQYVTTDWELGTATMYYVLADGSLYQAKINVMSLTPADEPAPEVKGSIERDPGNTGGELQYTIKGNTVTFTSGQIKWYPEDEDLGRAAGNRVGVQINAPADFDTSDVKVTIGETTYEWDKIEDGDGYFWWYPLVTAAEQEFTATVVWNESSTQEFKVVIGAEVTLEKAPDTTAPELVSVSPEAGSINLAYGETFKLEVTASDNNLHELEVDHNIADLAEFSVYADADDPYGGQGEAFAEAGVTVTYNAAEQKWIIDFGKAVTTKIVEKGGITFYLVIKDQAGNQWGSMSPPTEENTFAYNVTQEEVPDEVQFVWDVNNIEGEGNLRDKFLELNYDPFDELGEVKQTEVAKLFILSKGDKVYQTIDEIKTDIDAAINKYNELLGAVNASENVEAMKTALQAIGTLFNIDVNNLMAQVVLNQKPEGGYVSVSEIIAVIQDSIANVGTLEDFKAALAEASKTVINLTAGFETTEKILVSRDDVTINGNNKAITFTGDTAGWQGNYVLHVYKATGVTIKDIKLTGGDAALYANGSEVTLEGTVDITGNEFGGIEVSQGKNVTNVPKLTVNGTIQFTDTVTPTIWIDGKTTNDGWVEVTGFTEAAHTEYGKEQVWFTVEAPSDSVQEALEQLVAKTSMTVEGQANGFTASFDKAIEVPEVIEGYYIDVLVTLEGELTDGKVTILYNSKETAAKEIEIKDTKIWLSELVLDGEPAEFKSGPAATWTILVTDNEEAVTVKGAIKSIISSDGFKDEKVVLAEGSFEFTIGVKEATEEETMETIPVVIDTKETVVTQVKVADEINEEITEEPKEEVVSEESDKKNVDETTSGQEQISETEIDEEDADDTQVNQADVIEEDEVE